MDSGAIKEKQDSKRKTNYSFKKMMIDLCGCLVSCFLCFGVLFSSHIRKKRESTNPYKNERIAAILNQKGKTGIMPVVGKYRVIDKTGNKMILQGKETGRVLVWEWNNYCAQCSKNFNRIRVGSACNPSELQFHCYTHSGRKVTGLCGVSDLVKARRIQQECYRLHDDYQDIIFPLYTCYADFIYTPFLAPEGYCIKNDPSNQDYGYFYYPPKLGPEYSVIGSARSLLFLDTPERFCVEQQRLLDLSQDESKLGQFKQNMFFSDMNYPVSSLWPSLQLLQWQEDNISPRRIASKTFLSPVLFAEKIKKRSE